MTPTPPTLVLVDGHSLAYRMYFALERTGMKSPEGTPTWAVYGFFNALFALLRTVKPAALAVAFDVSSDTFRTALYADYKVHREAMPDALRQQMGLIRDGVSALGIPIYEREGFEADDVIGTLSAQAAAEGWQVDILTGDQDAFQLVVDGQVVVLLPPRTPKDNGLTRYDEAAVLAKWGVTPAQVVDFKALKGDTSDNIPGVPGIGDKTAAKLLQQFGSLAAIYAQVDTVTPDKLREKLTTHQDQALLSQRLATIDRAVPLEVTLKDCHLADPDVAAWGRFVATHAFRSFQAQSAEILGFFGAASPPPPAAERPELVLSAAPVTPRSTQQSLLTDSSAASLPHTILWDLPALDALLARARANGVLALDLETTGLDVLTTELVGVALSVADDLAPAMRPVGNPLGVPGMPEALSALVRKPDVAPNPETAYVPLGHSTSPQPQLPVADVLARLKPLLADESIVKIVHNAKFERNVFQRLGCPMRGLVFDTMIASYVLQPEGRHGLKALALERLGVAMTPIEALIGTGKKQIAFSEVPLEQAAPYAAADARLTLDLARHFLERLEESALPLLYEVELPLTEVLAMMERTGICLDVAYLNRLSGELDHQLQAVEADLTRLAGLPFNPNSPKQVGEILFGRLGIQPTKKTATKAYSTDAKVLEALVDEHPIIQKLLDYRQLAKLKSTYVDALPALIHPQTGRVHTSFNQTVTATGRLSSSNPNLQNIPIRTALGRQIRAAFIPPAREGWTLLSADYSQIELRLLAHVSEDPHLLKAFREGLDVHTATAALVFGLPVEEVSKDQRAAAKTVNFGIIYGQTAHGLSQLLGIPRAEAQAFIDRYFETYPRVRDAIEQVKATVRETGKVQTLYGRTRDLSADLANSNRAIREFAERAAFNTPLQGSAADLMKLAMNRLYARLESERAEHGLRTQLLLQVHDELVLEVPDDELPRIKTWVKEAMELGQPLRVPLLVDLYAGPTWLES